MRSSDFLCPLTTCFLFSHAFIHFLLALLLTLACSNSHLLLLLPCLSFFPQPLIPPIILFLLPSCLLPKLRWFWVTKMREYFMMHVEWSSYSQKRVIPRIQCFFQISPLLANIYLCTLGSLRNKPSEDGLPCVTILWKPFRKRVLCSWRGNEAVMYTRVMRKQKHEPNCLTQHLILLLE